MQSHNRDTACLNIGLFLFFFSGLSYVMTGINRYHLVVLILGIVLIFIGTGFPTVWELNGDVLGFFYLLCATFIGISYFKNQETSILMSALGLILVWLTVNVWIPSTSLGPYRSTYKILIVAHLICFIPSFASFSITRFSGVFRNPNGMGGAASTFSAVMFSLLLYHLVGEDADCRRFVKWDIAGIVFSLLLALCSTSRTSCIAVITMLAVSLLIVVYYGFMNSRIIRNMIMGIILLCIIGYLLYHYTIFSEIVSNVADKFVANNDDQLNGRGEYWTIIFERMSFFGNGEATETAAHNTFLSLLDQYGYVPFLSWIGFCVVGIIKSFKLALDRTYESPYKFLPLFSFLCFMIESMAEGMMLKTIMLIAVYSVSVLRYSEHFQFDACEIRRA